MALTRASAAVIKTEELVNNRNRIINGAMEIDQRYTGSANTVPNNTAHYVLDRWRFYENTDGVMSVQRSSDAPEGHRNSMLVTITTADASLSSAQIGIVSHRIEGNNMHDFDWGRSTAKTATLSFWVKSSLTGKFSGSFYNMNASSVQKTYVFDYNINSANTWEYKTITVSGDTNANWATGTNASLEIIWGFGTGSDYKTSTINQWFTGFASQSTGSVDLFNTVNATWQITGVQFEVGSVATPFERRPYGMELALCQRYYQIVRSTYETSLGTTGNIAAPTVTFSTPMRASPTITASLQNEGSGATIILFTSNGNTETGFYSFQMALTVSTSGYTYRYMRGPAEAEL